MLNNLRKLIRNGEVYYNVADLRRYAGYTDKDKRVDRFLKIKQVIDFIEQANCRVI